MVYVLQPIQISHCFHILVDLGTVSVFILYIRPLEQAKIIRDSAILRIPGRGASTVGIKPVLKERAGQHNAQLGIGHIVIRTKPAVVIAVDPALLMGFLHIDITPVGF